ncbi:hypothetical protein [Paraburkholderia fungorum]|nr:hypothetical protein [Paraburkholderia fungorum]
MSALALATMTIVPLLISRVARSRSTLATTATLMTAMTAMSSAPAYVGGLEHDIAIAGLLLVVGGALLFYRWHLVSAPDSPPEDFDRNRYTNQSTDRPNEALHATGAMVLLALFAGLSSGLLARFQLYAICGVGGAQPIWQIVLSLGAVCALAFMADRSDKNSRMLVVLYVLRATSIAGLAASDSPTAALFAAKIFVILDCLTIPALTKLRGKSHSAMSASCPGAAHHIGMALGATLSTTPYFFGAGFTTLYVLGAIANVTCAGTLAGKWFARRQPRHRTTDPTAVQTVPTRTRCESGSMTALSPGRSVREHRFQMHHYRGCAGDPLMSWRCEPLSLLIFLCGGKESKCRPAQGQH